MWSASMRAPFSMSRNIEAVKFEPGVLSMVRPASRPAAPGAKPFVEIGTEVKPGDTLCVIEAMKMMNQIESEFAGRVVSVLVENGNPVEFGQPLFVIEE